jgi:hypothetical protein
VYIGPFKDPFYSPKDTLSPANQKKSQQANHSYNTSHQQQKVIKIGVNLA